MAKKRRRKSRTSLGREGHPRRCRNSTGMARLLNQAEAFAQGKNVVLDAPAFSGYEGITVTISGKTMSLSAYLQRRGTRPAGKDEKLRGKVNASKYWRTRGSKGKKQQRKSGS